MQQETVPVMKRLAKAITTPETRDTWKRWAFQLYTRIYPRKSQYCQRRPFGVNLIGHIRGDFGLGESCRIVAGILKTAQIPFTIYNLPLNGPASEGDLSWTDYEENVLPYNINLIHLNPNEIANAIWKLDRSVLRSSYNIAYWLWELPEFPDEWAYTFCLFDEIWVPTEFIAQSIRKKTQKPVYVMPYGIKTPQTNAQFDRAYFRLPENLTLFMLSYDGNSVSERKNPKGAIRAYCKAFSPKDTGVGLVVKATHAQKEDEVFLETLKREYPNIFVLTDSYTKEEFNSLIACVDVYVSLHRAEGFGLVMAEAMLLGTAVVATDWSANTEFMNGTVACMVPAEVVELEQDCFPYRKGNHWANPDEDIAARMMRQLYDDPAKRKDLTETARRFVQENLSYEKAAHPMENRLEELKKEEKLLP